MGITFVLSLTLIAGAFVIFFACVFCNLTTLLYNIVYIGEFCYDNCSGISSLVQNHKFYDKKTHGFLLRLVIDHNASYISLKIWMWNLWSQIEIYWRNILASKSLYSFLSPYRPIIPFSFRFLVTFVSSFKWTSILLFLS